MDDKPKQGDGAEESESPEVSADSAEAQADVMLASAKQHSENENQSNRNKLLAAIAVAFLISIGVFFFVSSSSSDNSNENDSASQSENSSTDENETEPEAVADNFDQLIYAHSTNTNIQRDIFTRPVTGGDRSEIDFDLGVNNFLIVDRGDQSYVVGTNDGKVFYGMGISEPSEIFTTTNTLTGLSFDESSGTVLVTERDESDFSQYPTTLTVVNVDGSGTEEFFTEVADPGSVIYPESWDGSASTLYMRRSCTQCDGYNPVLLTLDADGNEDTFFTPSTADPNTGFEISSGYAFNFDHSNALYVTNTQYDESNPFGINGGIGSPEGAPYTLHEINLADGTSSEVLTFGEGDDVAANGFFDSPRIDWAVIGGNSARVYSYQKKLFVQNRSGGFDNYFETDQDVITSIYFVDSDEIVVGSRNDDGETISYYNITDQAGAIVMETLPTTTILGLSKN
jgi:hypothetical protein